MRCLGVKVAGSYSTISPVEFRTHRRLLCATSGAVRNSRVRMGLSLLRMPKTVCAGADAFIPRYLFPMLRFSLQFNSEDARMRIGAQDRA